MARYKLILAYDGTHFHGFQRQALEPTVQGAIEEALRRLGWAGSSLLAAGRTDSGAHAAGQVVAFDLDWRHSPEDLTAALNALLPQEVAAREAQVVSSNFHPRYNATARQYVYRIFSQPIRDPLRERYAWRVWPSADHELLQRASSAILGTHDFAAFGTPPRAGGTTVRTVNSASWRLGNGSWDTPELVFEIVANAFLYRMVRRIVYIQVAIAQGNLDEGTILQYLQWPPLSPLQGLAPAYGLTLTRVYYPQEDR
jgi:tRNA pseudouridine38-40 synthase